MEDREHLSQKQMAALRNQMKKANEERQLEIYRKRLDKIISTKIRTAFIGAIAKFEENFGFLWGQDKPKEELTEQEEQMDELWNQTRTAILNNGNNQLRAAQNEIQMHVVNWKRHHIDLIIKKEDEDNA